MKSIIKKSIYILLIWLIVHTIIISIDGFSDSGKNADYAVVLGNKVNTDGTLSTRLEKRMKCALDLYESGRIKGFIVSGGFGQEGYYEGDKMREYLLKHGIPDSLIIVDNDGINTRNTVKNTLDMQDSLHYNSLIVVSQYFHITRTKALFRKAGLKNIYGASPLYFELRDFHSLLREFAAFYTQCL
ncbi:MAG: YdcF family protein [Tannerella sp.]|jgi:vancomycin permeability regulator SanA|nr:YdcF family protein [Tannerella sp.]